MWSRQFVVFVACVSVSSYGKDLSDRRPVGCVGESSDAVNGTDGVTDLVGGVNITGNTTHFDGHADKHNRTGHSHEDRVQNSTEREPHSHHNRTDQVSDKNHTHVPDTSTEGGPIDHNSHMNRTEKPQSNGAHKTPRNTTKESDKKSAVGFWVPIFNFGDDFYFGTNKGYAKLVNFPAPVIYAFRPVVPTGTRGNGVKKPQGEPKADGFDDKTGNYFDNESNFADCYVNKNMGNMIPYSYFGSWVPIFNFDNGWHLQTYVGFVPLDMNGSEVPLTYEFDPIMYRYSSVESVTAIGDTSSSSSTKDPGLAQWHGPVVLED